MIFRCTSNSTSSCQNWEIIIFLTIFSQRERFTKLRNYHVPFPSNLRKDGRQAAHLCQPHISKIWRVRGGLVSYCFQWWRSKQCGGRGWILRVYSDKAIDFPAVTPRKWKRVIQHRNGCRSTQWSRVAEEVCRVNPQFFHLAPVADEFLQKITCLEVT